uniref:Uncharacterized protein n=1 Tax=Magallana gigas TaxID=29159 RepID=A0A8W8NVM3_MAGGI
MSCNHATGQCDEGCASGWTGTTCDKECKAGTYGHNCVNNCSGHCLHDSHCNKQTGHCDSGCNLGYTNGDCSKDDISYNKVATLSPPSTAVNLEAKNAVDGNIATCMRTGDIEVTAKDKTVWWIVDLGRVYNVYNINIQFKNYDGYETRQRGRFAGFSLTRFTLCYEHGDEVNFEKGFILKKKVESVMPCVWQGRIYVPGNGPRKRSVWVIYSYEPILSTHPVKGRTSVLQLVVDHRTHDIDQVKRKQGATIQRFKDCEKPNKTHQNKVHRSVKKRIVEYNPQDFHQTSTKSRK